MTDIVIDVHPVSPGNPFPWRRILHQAAFWSVMLGVATIALIAGLLLRRYAWDQTEPIRFVEDIDNAFKQGTYALRTGFVERYDEQESRPLVERNSTMALDYAPGRLAIATLWTRWVRTTVDGPINSPKDLKNWPEEFYFHARDLGRPYELCKPLLMLNVTGELLSAIALFFLARRYTSGVGSHFRPMRGAMLGLVAALFFWFDPALISNAHCWPQWDSWVLPFFLWAVLLASLDWWFCAGLVIAGGAMFKAQILFAIPLFVLWPLFQGRLTAIVRWSIGVCFGVAALTSVWLVRTPGTATAGHGYAPGSVSSSAIQWLIYMAAILGSVIPIVIWPRRSAARIPGCIAVAGAFTWLLAVWLGGAFSEVGFCLLSLATIIINQRWRQWHPGVNIALACVAILLLMVPVFLLNGFAPGGRSAGFALLWLSLLTLVGLLIHFAPRRVIPYTAAAWMAAALLLCSPMYHTSTAWFDRGIAFGTHHYEKMASGDNNNLPELLQTKWRWDNLMEPVFKLPPGEVSDAIAIILDKLDPGVHLKPGGEVGLPLKYFLTTVWVLSVILCAIGTAAHDRRRSPRFLASIAAPWIMFFAVMTQMHQRYLLWGASISSATAVMGPGYALLHLFLSAVSMGQELTSMMNNGLDWRHPVHYTDNAAYQFFHNWHPGVSWAVLLTACIFVYTSVKRDKRKVE
jgi:hypothetical protein